MDLAQATGATEFIDLAGEEHAVRLLTLREWGSITAWLKRANPSPVTRAARAIEQADELGEPLSIATRETLLDHAQRSALNWPPRLGSTEWFEAFDRTAGGQSYLLHQVLVLTEPRFDVGSAEVLAKRMDVDSWNELLRMALLRDTPPRPESRGGRRGRLEDEGADDWAMVKFRLVDECGIDPVRFGDLTYPDIVNILTRGNPDKLHRELWQARKILADHRAGRLVWREDPDGKTG